MEELSHAEFEAQLPERVAAAEERFGVRAGARFDPGAGGFVAPVSPEAVLKVSFPHDEAERWVEELPADWERAGRPCSRSLLHEAVALARDLGSSIGESYLLHQDFQGSNVIESQRGWLVIDPKPLAGDRAFDLASLLRDRHWELTPALVRRRFDVLTGLTGVERERARGWGIVHALAWGMDDRSGHVLAAEALATVKP